MNRKATFFALAASVGIATAATAETDRADALPLELELVAIEPVAPPTDQIQLGDSVYKVDFQSPQPAKPEIVAIDPDLLAEAVSVTAIDEFEASKSDTADSGAFDDSHAGKAPNDP